MAPAEWGGTDPETAERPRLISRARLRGYRVLRFSNRDVMPDIEMVLDTIAAALSSPPDGTLALPVAPPHEVGGKQGAASSHKGER